MTSRTHSMGSSSRRAVSVRLAELESKSKQAKVEGETLRERQQLERVREEIEKQKREIERQELVLQSELERKKIEIEYDVFMRLQEESSERGESLQLSKEDQEERTQQWVEQEKEVNSDQRAENEEPQSPSRVRDEESQRVKDEESQRRVRDEELQRVKDEECRRARDEECRRARVEKEYQRARDQEYQNQMAREEEHRRAREEEYQRSERPRLRGSSDWTWRAECDQRAGGDRGTRGEPESMYSRYQPGSAQEHVDLGTGTVPTRSRPTETSGLPFASEPQREILVARQRDERGDQNSGLPLCEKSLQEQLIACIKRRDAPDCDIEPFAGDPLSFHIFMKQFEDSVESKIDDPASLLNRLLKFTEGSAKELVKAYLYEPKEVGFRNAKAMLQHEYGDPYTIANAYAREIRTLPVIKYESSGELRKLFLFLQKVKICAQRVQQIGMEMNAQENLRALASKLPYKLQERWSRTTTTNWSRNGSIPTLEQFTNFVKTEADVASKLDFRPRDGVAGGRDFRPRDGVAGGRDFRPRDGVAGGRDFRPRDGGAGGRAPFGRAPPSAPRHLAAATEGRAVLTCAMCEKSGHEYPTCREFQKLSVSERKEYVGKRNMCFACLKACSNTHYARVCGDRLKCEVCGGWHPTVFHQKRDERIQETKDKDDPKPQTKSNVTSASTNCSTTVSMNCVEVIATSKYKPGKGIRTLAFLDTLSNTSFIAESLRKQLYDDSPGQVEFTITTMTGEEKVSVAPVTGVKIQSTDRRCSMELPTLYAREELPVGVDDVAGREVLDTFPHLRDLDIELPDVNLTVGLILGSNVPRALEPHDVVRGATGTESPYAVKTAFGWSICGPIRDTGEKRAKANFVMLRSGGAAETAITVNSVDPGIRDINQRLEQLYRTDFIERNEESQSKKSQEDYEFLELMERETVLLPEGRYQLPLPLRDESINLPDNKKQAFEQALRLKRALVRKKDEPDGQILKRKYVEFMEKIIEKGHAQRVPGERFEEPQKWYLVYHGIQQREGKFRVVFNCSKRFGGTSLNDNLITGPAVELTNSIVKVVLRWRQEPYAVAGDITAMFYQTRVPVEQRSYLRFFWWDNPELEGDPVAMEMNVHLFGAGSSPSVANYALRRTAWDNAADFEPEIINSVLDNFYVDDWLKSFPDIEGGQAVISKVRELLLRGGFDLNKFKSNDPRLLQKLPEELRADTTSRSSVLDESHVMSDGGETVERALGIEWFVEQDAIGFKVSVGEYPFTKRGLLGAISSLWDVLGLASPFILPGRKILQRLSRSEGGWDDPIPEEIAEQWRGWLAGLRCLEKIQLPRSYRSPEFVVKKREVHVFADASDIGYGVAVYLKLIDDGGRTACTLIFGKSRVVPLDGETIPRSELVAAVMAAELSAVVLAGLQYESIETYYWTDSMVVLSYIRNKQKRFKTFVANRLRRIHKLTRIEQWSHVSTKENPADYASRGLDASRARADHTWFTGPKFLHETETTQAKVTTILVSDTDPELKKEQTVLITKTITQEAPTTVLLRKFSDWTKLKRIVANIQIGLKRQLRPITVHDLEIAQEMIIKYIQGEHFPEEFHALKEGKTLPSNSVIVKLDPFLDERGVLRVGGRLENSELEQALKNPIILPKLDPVVDCIVRYCHSVVEHGGRNATLNELRRNGFWIVNSNSKVRYILNQCVICKRCRGKPETQFMAALPKDRVTESPPFTYVGVDLFGPFQVKIGRRSEKHYGVIFTCLVSRAVHIETVESLETDAFINCLARFIGRRGPIRVLRSDNGTNFTGANAELRRSFQGIEFDKVREFLLKENCDLEIGFKWKFNTPTASNHGGSWERLIRSIRAILGNILLQNPCVLTPKTLETFLVQIENIVNSRPLTCDFSDPKDPCPLAPINLLTQKTKLIVPPFGEFLGNEEQYSRRRWRRVQHLAEVFFIRFKKEYLQKLQERQKWFQEQKNIKVNDIVLLKEEAKFRNDWRMARVLEVYPDQMKGHVRSVKLRMCRSDFRKPAVELLRPVTKLVMLIGYDNRV